MGYESLSRVGDICAKSREPPPKVDCARLPARDVYLVAELKQIGTRYFVDVDVYEHLGLALVERVDHVLDQFKIGWRVAGDQRIQLFHCGQLLGGRQRALYGSFHLLEVGVLDVESAQRERLILHARLRIVAGDY